MDWNSINQAIIEAEKNVCKPKNLSKGSKVRCISIDNHQSQWGGNDSAEEYLTIGAMYTLARDPEVHSWHTKLYLEEVPGKMFNSVQFEEVE